MPGPGPRRATALAQASNRLLAVEKKAIGGSVVVAGCETDAGSDKRGVVGQDDSDGGC